MAAAGLGQTCIPDDASAHPRKLSLALDGFLVHPQSEEQVMGGWREGGGHRDVAGGDCVALLHLLIFQLFKVLIHPPERNCGNVLN